MKIWDIFVTFIKRKLAKIGIGDPLNQLVEYNPSYKKRDYKKQ